MTDALEEMGTDYVNSIIDDLRTNPSLEEGMHVSVYGHQEGRPFLGYGIVLDAWWSEFYCQWCAHIHMYDGTLRECCMGCNLERVKWKSSVQYAALKSRVIEGGVK